MNIPVSNNFTLAELYQKVTTVITDKADLFRGLTITNISINKKLTTNKYRYSYYVGTNKGDSKNKNYTVNLKISNSIIKQHNDKNGESSTYAKYDIEIDTLEIDDYGRMTIIVKSIRETGISDRELLKRRLEKYIKEKGYTNRTKKPLPKLVTTILALTSKASEIEEDILSNLNLPISQIDIKRCLNSEDIAKEIENANPQKYDIVVMYRGGREDDAMSIFSNEKIIDAIVKSKIPVCVALGHEIDRPFIYEVADQSYSTPSSFGKSITMHNRKAKDENRLLLNEIRDSIRRITEGIESKNTKLFENIKNLSIQLSEKANSKIDRSTKDINSNITRAIDQKLHYINHLEKMIWQHVNNIELKHKELKQKNRIYTIYTILILCLIAIIIFLLLR